MRHGVLAVGISLLLHSAVFAALLPNLFGAPETPPRALVVMSVEIADGLPGQRRAPERETARNAGSAAAESAESQTARARRERARDARAAEIAAQTRAAREEAARQAAEAAARRRAEIAARRQAERRRERERQTAEARRAAERAERNQARQNASAAANAARAGETVPPRFGAGSGANPLPPYPDSARYMGHEGTVVLRVRVRPDGRSDWVRIEESSGHTALDDAARRTIAERWRFEPARRGEERIAATVLVPIRFQLEGR